MILITSARDGGSLYWRSVLFFRTFPHGCGDKPRYARRCAPPVYCLRTALCRFIHFSQYLFLAAPAVALNLVGMVLMLALYRCRLSA